MDTRARTNPFPGLRPFLQEEAHLFFGRDKQSDELVRRLASRRFLAVVGSSGSGKTSLVRAGLLPSLEGGLMAEAGAHWRIAILRPQDDPIGFLARAIVEAGLLTHLDLAQPAAEGVVETTLRRSGLGLIEATRLARLEARENLLILVDQFEELFRFADLAKQRDAGDEAPAFVKLLLEAAQQTEVPVYVVITMRSDFLGDCDRFRGLPEAISDSQYLIPRLTRDELQAAITGPIGVRGGRIASSLVQRLLNDVGDDMDQLPILQHALMRAWDHWERSHPDGRSIDLSDLKVIGGMAEALSRHADEAFGSLTTDRDRKIAERLFKCLTEKGPDNREIRRPTQLSPIAAIANADPAEVIPIIDVFRAPERSFLMPPYDVALGADSVIDISHESLIRRWGRLRTWVEEEAESRGTYLRLVEAAQLRRAGKAGLWGEPGISYARQWQERETPNKTWAERYGPGFNEAWAFLRDSEFAHAEELDRERQRAEVDRLAKERELLAEAQRQRAEAERIASERELEQAMALAEAQRQRAEAERIASERELEQAMALAEEQRQRADERAATGIRLKRFILVLAVLSLLATVTAIYAWTQRRESEIRGQLALSRQLASQANIEIGRGLQLAFLLAVAGYRTDPTDEAIQSLQRVLAAQPQIRIFLSGQRGAVSSVAFSPDGMTLASAGQNGTVILWNVARGTPFIEPLKGHQDAVSTVAFSPNGKTLASAGEDGSVRLWDTASSKPLGEPFKGHQGAVLSVAFSPNGKTLASAGEDGSVRLWDTASSKPLGEPFKGHQGAVLSVAFSPNGKTLASAGEDGSVRLWDMASSKPLGEPFKGHQGAVLSVAFSPNGKTLASAGEDGSVRLWDMASSKPLGEPFKGHQGAVRSVAFSPDGRALASASQDGTVILWGVASRRPLGEPLKGQQGAVSSVAFSPDGRALASASQDGTVILWDVASRRPLGEPLKGQQGAVSSVAFSPDGRALASASQDGTVILWDVASRRPLGEPLKGQQGAVSSVAFSPDGKTLASAGEDGSVILWDVASRRPLGEPLKGQQGAVSSVAFSPDGKTLASAGQNGTVILWDVASSQPLGEPLSGEQGALLSVAFSPDNKTFASAGENAILWDVASRRPLGEPLKSQQGAVSSVAFGPDGKTLASAGQNGTVILWNVANRIPLGAPLWGRQRVVSNVAFSPDGKTLASAGQNGTVILWNVARGTPFIEPLKGHQDAVSSVAFSPDGKTLASASQDETVIMWDLDVASWVRMACAIANRNLTLTEWRQYVGEVPYRNLCPDLPVSYT